MEKVDFLVVIAIIVVCIALAGLVVTVKKVGNMTGAATDTATATFDIESAASIQFVVNSIAWGNGAVDEGPTFAIIDSEGTVTDGNWSAVSTALLLQNDGNTNVSVSLTASNVASALIGGDSPSYKLKLSENEADSCAGTNSLSSYTEVTGSSQSACDNFGFTSSYDALDIDVRLVIPEDALPGSRSSTITATATVI